MRLAALVALAALPHLAYAQKVTVRPTEPQLVALRARLDSVSASRPFDYGAYQKLTAGFRDAVQRLDVIVSAAGEPFTGAGAFADRIGQEVPFVIARGYQRQTLSLRVGARSVPQISIVATAVPTDEQRALRERWLGP